MLSGQDNDEIEELENIPAYVRKKITIDQPMSSADTVADKLEVYYFHRTARCYSCQTIGQYVRETMAGQYAGEIKGGRIDFREINVGLLEEQPPTAENYTPSLHDGLGIQGGPGASPGRRLDRDNNPPGPKGGQGTNWENRPGPQGGPGGRRG